LGVSQGLERCQRLLGASQRGRERLDGTGGHLPGERALVGAHRVKGGTSAMQSELQG
jgi:hypothetical protein